MTDRELMMQALEWIEAQPEPRMLGAFSVIKALRDRLYRPSTNVLNQGCSGCGDTSTEDSMTALYCVKCIDGEMKGTPPQDEIKRLKDLLGKANALCRIRQNKIKELEEVLREMQDWEALAADQALTISLLRSEQKPEYWQEEARRYAQNADFWRQKYESVTVQRTRRVV